MKPLLLSSELLDVIINGGIAFIVAVFITRWVFGIDKIQDALKEQNKLALQQVKLLTKLCEKAGVSPDELRDIIVDKKAEEKSK